MNYDKAAATSLRMLTAFGKSVTLRTFTLGTYDTTTGTVAEPTSADETRKAVILEFSRRESGTMLRNGTLITSSDKRCLMDANGVAPLLASRVVDGTTEYTIQDVKELNPAGTPILYDLVIRK